MYSRMVSLAIQEIWTDYPIIEVLKMWDDIIQQRLEDIDAEIAELRRQKELLMRDKHAK